jgi:hypothetical protein
LFTNGAAMSVSDKNHLPDLGKTFVAILEHYTTKVIGDSAKDEIKKPHERKNLREQLEKVFVYTEQRFVAEFDDQELCDAIINLPIADLPSLVSVHAKDVRQRGAKLNVEHK